MIRPYPEGDRPADSRGSGYKSATALRLRDDRLPLPVDHVLALSGERCISGKTLRYPRNKPFCWTKSADDILASINRFCLRTLQSTHISESGH